MITDLKVKVIQQFLIIQIQFKNNLSIIGNQYKKISILLIK